MNRDYSDAEIRNRDVVLDFYLKAVRDWDFNSAAQHLGPYYIQHNPNVKDGADGFRAFIENVPPEVSRHLEVVIRRVIVDGDMVVLHVFNCMPDDPGMAHAEFFRLEAGKIVEHWDVLQPVPSHSVNGNGMI